MNTQVMLMAGGRGTRMASGDPGPPKVLRVVGGRTLLEHSIREAFKHGLREIIVVAPAHTPAVIDAAHKLSARLAPEGALLRVEIEDEPRGNMGATSILSGHCEVVLVLFADNLSDMDLGALLRTHHTRSADLTLATHLHSTRLPYGLLELKGEVVQAYREKPELHHHVCSGTYVLGPRALELVPSVGVVHAEHVVNTCLSEGLRVLAWEHEALWFDVNDPLTAAHADRALARVRR